MLARRFQCRGKVSHRLLAPAFEKFGRFRARSSVRVGHCSPKIQIPAVAIGGDNEGAIIGEVIREAPIPSALNSLNLKLRLFCDTGYFDDPCTVLKIGD